MKTVNAVGDGSLLGGTWQVHVHVYDRQTLVDSSSAARRLCNGTGRANNAVDQGQLIKALVEIILTHYRCYVRCCNFKSKPARANIHTSSILTPDTPNHKGRGSASNAAMD